MATILDALIPKFLTDSVAVFDQNFNQVFPLARPIKAVVKEEAKLMEHPVESGAVITDHRIILPVEIELSLLVQGSDIQDTYRVIRQLYLNSTELVVQTKSGVYENQIIAGLPHEEDPEQYSTLVIALKLKQVQTVTARYALAPRRASHSSTVNRGTQQPSMPHPSVLRTLV